MHLWRKLISAPVATVVKLAKSVQSFSGQPYTSKSYVIGIGSPFAGGAGKTELSNFCYSLLKKFHPLVLLKGYKGRVKKPTLVTGCSDSVSLFGDEAVMLANQGIQVAVSHNKSLGVKHFESSFPVIIVDDALQHHRLAPDLVIMTIPIEDPLSVELALSEIFYPVGPLRDFFSDCLHRSDFIVLLDRSGQEAALDENVLNVLNRAIGEKPTFKAKYQIDLPNVNEVSVVTSIARPQGLLLALKKRNITVVKHYFFPDHHFFSKQDVIRIEREARGVILTTIKDWTKIQFFADQDRWFVVKPTLYFLDGHSFADSLMKRVKTGLADKKLGLS